MTKEELYLKYSRYVSTFTNEKGEIEKFPHPYSEDENGLKQLENFFIKLQKLHGEN